MTAMLDSYSAQLRSSLPNLDDAEHVFQRVGGLIKIQRALVEIAKQHPSASKYGLHLLHRHSDLADDEIMIECGPATQPFRLSELSAAARNDLQPTLWGVCPDTKNFTPLQFTFEDQSDKGAGILDVAFARAVADLLVQHELEHVFGLATTDPDQEVMVETTHGRAEIVTPERTYASMPASVEVLWPLSGLEAGGHRKCGTRCVQNSVGDHRVWHDGSSV